mgnify:CR=1 FL=1
MEFQKYKQFSSDTIETKFNEESINSNRNAIYQINNSENDKGSEEDRDPTKDE